MAKKQNANKIKRTDVLYYRMLIAFAVLIGVVFSITYLTNTPDRANTFVLEIAPKITLVASILLIPTIVFFVARKVKGTDESLKIFASGYLLLMNLWVVSVFGLYNQMSTKKLFAYIVVTAALYFIYYLYSRDFFAFSLYNAIYAVLLMFIYSASFAEHVILAVLAVLASVGVVAMALASKKKPITLTVGKRTKIKITSGPVDVYPLCISAGIVLAGVILSFFVAGSAFYSIIALFAYYLIFTVVKTIRMM